MVNPLIIFPMSGIKIKCFYHDYKNEKLWEYTGQYTEFRKGIPNAPALGNEWQIPVLVDEKNYGNYYVLTKELVHSYRDGFWEKPFYFTRVIRKVDLSEVENGMKFSNSVKFR